jgi:hypothetical protein
MATETENVAEEVQREEVVQPQEEQKAQSQDTQEVSQEQSDENNKEYNFRQLRESNKQLAEKLRKTEEIIESIAQKQNQTAQSEEELNLGEEDLVEGKHLKKVIGKIEKMIQQKDLEAIPDRLRNKFEDFDHVVTKENLEKLKESEPELYRTIRSGTDLFAKGVAAYKTLRSLGYAQERENYMKQKDIVQSNHKKPLSAQAVKGQGALHEANVFANGLTPELKKQLQKEMVEAAKAR